MSETAKRQATYEDLHGVPEHATGQILDGELVVTPRPSRRHVFAASALEIEVGSAFQFGRGGPGGWVILVEPEVRMGDDIVVPDLAGWRRERFPVSEDSHSISAVPDWCCEVLSPNTVRSDRIRKMSLYGRHGVRHVWLVDPVGKTLEVFGLHESGSWVTLGLHAEDERVRAAPFQEVESCLTRLWLD